MLVSPEEDRRLAESQKMHFVETSALTQRGVIACKEDAVSVNFAMIDIDAFVK